MSPVTASVESEFTSPPLFNGIELTSTRSPSFPGAVPNAYFDGAVQQAYPTRSSALLASNLYEPAADSSDGFRNSFTALTTDESW